MSSYENYHQSSRVFDRTRSACGIDIIQKVMAEGLVPPLQQILVDAGCGTGLYSAALIDQVQRIEAVDLNASMLAVAKSRLTEEEKAGRIRFHQASIDSMPLLDESVDVLIVNQVLHHLPDEVDTGWPLHGRVFSEFARVLKIGGYVIINSCSHEQLEHGFWFYRFIPDALKMLQENILVLDPLDGLLRESGFACPRR